MIVEEANRKALEEQQKAAAIALARQEAQARMDAQAKVKEEAKLEEIRKANELAQYEANLRTKEEANLAEYIEKVKKNEVGEVLS